MENAITVVVIDDHPLFRGGVIQTIDTEPDITVVGDADTAAAGAETTLKLLPDVILLDINLPDHSGLVVAEIVRRECPSTKIVVLTVADDDDTAMKALRGGAHAYILKGVSGEQLVEAVRSVHRGEIYVTPSVAGRLLAELSTDAQNRTETGPARELTTREHEILALVSLGKTNKEIGLELFLSEKTIKNYMTTVLQKLQVRNRVEAALAAKRDTPTTNC